MSRNIYLDEVSAVLPRLLALFDQDKTSVSHGMGDRFYWAWGLTDFGNATFQGAVHGLARLWRHGLWPLSTGPAVFLARIDAIFSATAKLTRRDGSLEEAFPNEGSFCVTALVAYDLLSARELLAPELDEATHARWLSVVAPLIRFLMQAEETHALISNHLATAVAALVKWQDATGDMSAGLRAQNLLKIILHHQSSEGWLLEYEGADPGYQSLCTYYLADVHRMRPDWGLAQPLAHSLAFLWHFAHPDGSFGGIYGSRCTRFYYPTGVELLADQVPEAAALAWFMSDSIADKSVVTLSAMDDTNLVPMFNAYCWAAAVRCQRSNIEAVAPKLPCEQRAAMHLNFPEAGLIIDAGADHYTVISTHKGGVVMHFRGDRLVLCDGGVVVRSPNGILGSTQAYAPENRVTREGGVLTVEAKVAPMPKRLPTPFEFLLLRGMCVTVFRFRGIREAIKRLLVRLLITRRTSWPVRQIRQIRLGPDLAIEDRLEAAPGYSALEMPGAFIPIHMASQGYWQRQDEEVRS